MANAQYFAAWTLYPGDWIGDLKDKLRKHIKIEYVETDGLVPWLDNPRQISQDDAKALERSIKEFGFVDPIIARRTDKTIIGGHQRLDVAIKHGFKQVPVVFLEISDAKMKALNLALNKISGEFDEELLAEIFADMKGVDPTVTGFTQEEIESLQELRKDGELKGENDYSDYGVRQITFSFKAEVFDKVIERLEVIMREMHVTSHTEAFLGLLANYENTKPHQKTARPFEVS